MTRRAEEGTSHDGGAGLETLSRCSPAMRSVVRPEDEEEGSRGQRRRGVGYVVGYVSSPLSDAGRGGGAIGR